MATARGPGVKTDRQEPAALEGPLVGEPSAQGAQTRRRIGDRREDLTRHPSTVKVLATADPRRGDRPQGGAHVV